MNDKIVKIREKHRVSYSHVDENKKVTPHNMARWMQDIFLKQDDILDIDRDDELAWILLSYDLNIYKYPVLSDEITVTTYPYSFNRFYGNRIFTIENSDGEIIIEAKTKWLLVSKESFSIKQLNKDIIKTYGFDELEKGKGFQIDAIDEEVFDAVEGKKLFIRHDDIDINSHVNNTVYFSYPFDYIDRDILKKYEIYKIQILYKDSIRIDTDCDLYSVTKEEDEQMVTYIKIAKGDKLYTTIKILWKERDYK